MAPKPRAMKKTVTNQSHSLPKTVPTAPPGETTQPSSTSTSTRKTRGTIAAVAANPQTVAPPHQLLNGVQAPAPAPPKAVPSPGPPGKSQANAVNGRQPQRSKASSQKASATSAPSTRKRGASDGEPAQAKAAKKKKKVPPAPEQVSSDDDVALALARRAVGKRDRRAAGANTAGAQTVGTSECDLPSADEAVQSGDGEASGQSNAEDEEEEDAQESDPDGLESDDEGLAAQFAVEKPVWAKKTPAKNKPRAPPTYADIGAPRSEKARRLCDRPIESSPGSGSAFEPEEESTDEDELVTDEEVEKEWLKTIQERAARAKAKKALPPLLPPTTAATTTEKPAWKASKKSTAAIPKTLVLSAQQDVIDVDSNEPGGVSDSEPDVQGNPPPAAPAGDGPDIQPASAYTIVRPDHGVVNLTAQHVHIRKAVRDVLPRLEAKLAFENAFPDTITLSRDVNDTLMNVAHEHGHTGLEQALRVNTQLSSALGAIVKQRMSTYRGNLKKLADTHVTAYYQLKPGCGPYASLLFDHLTYCYVHTFDSVNVRVQVSWNKPYGHEIFPAMLQAAFFNGGSSIAARNAELFMSTLDTRPDEKEIPIAMLAFIGTAIHASLTEWHTGTHTHVSFSADAFLDVYNEHRILLNGIKAGNARGFHSMMHRLYRDASGTTPTNSDAAVAAANNALAHVDFANMDVD